MTVETMGETGRRFKRLFGSTPAQAQVMLEDPVGNAAAPERTVWYQSKFLRANLHFRGERFYLRDVHVYHDDFAQPYLTEPVRQHGIEQRMLAVLDGYHWSDDEVHSGRVGRRAMGRFAVVGPDGKSVPLTMAGRPAVSQTDSSLAARVPLADGGSLEVVFREREIAFNLLERLPHTQLALIFEWVADRSAFQEVAANQMHYRFRGFNYAVRIANGVVSKTADGATILANRDGTLRLILAQ